MTPAKRIMHLLAVLAVAALSLSLNACAWMKPSGAPAASSSGESIISQLRQDYEQLGDFKGISRFSLINQAPVQSGRIAFAVSPPDRLRVEMLNPFGLPMISLASNGKRLSFYSRQEDRFRAGGMSRSIMDAAVGIPLAPRDMAWILAGFAPIAEHSKITTSPWTLSGRGLRAGSVISLKPRLGWTKEKIWVGRDGRTVHKAEMYGRFGRRLYTVFLSPKDSNPREIRVVSPQGASLVLKEQRFWEGASVDESQFMLTKDKVAPQ